MTLANRRLANAMPRCLAHSCLLAIPMMCAAAAPPSATNLSSYRGMQLGMDPPTAAIRADANLSAVRIEYQQPALIQEMDWEPRAPVMADPAKPDPVKSGLLCFYNGELFRMIITYDRYKVEGMTAEDMVEGISATYGQAERPAAEIAYHSIYGESTSVIARWEDPQYAYSLVRTGDQTSFALILSSKRLDALAQAAITDAVRMEAHEAPKRELDRQKKRDEAERLTREKARSINKPNFRP